MSIAIIFASLHGTTKKVSRLIQQNLNNFEVHLFDLKENNFPDIKQYDSVIVGGSIHGGQIQKSVSDFIEVFRNDLLTKKLGLFICCMVEDKAEQTFENVFPIDLKTHAIAKGILGGEFNFEEMNLIERIVVRNITRSKCSISKINEHLIKQFAAIFVN